MHKSLFSLFRSRRDCRLCPLIVDILSPYKYIQLKSMGTPDETTALLVEVQQGTDNFITSSTTTASNNSSNSNQQQQQQQHNRRPRSDSYQSHTTAQLLSEIVADVKEELLDVLQEDVITPIKPRDEGDHSYKLSAVALAVMVFYKVSGGPFGCEPTVQAAGPLYAILGFIIFPLLWCIPEAFITAELGSAYPEPSGRKCTL